MLNFALNAECYFQSSALLTSLPVWENVAFGLMAARRISRSEALDIAIARLEEVELSA